MIARTLAAAALLAAMCGPASAQQTPQRVRPPRALLERMMVDLDHEVDFTVYGIDSLARYITVTRRDFNGDGVREWEVQGTRYCGTNCAWWIYRRLSSGRFQQVYAGGGTGIGILRTRTHGWNDISVYQHMSCCSGPSRISVFDGRRYQWRETRYLVWDEQHRARTAHRVYLTPPEDPGPQRLVLDPFDVGGGLWVSARYDICRPGRVRTDVCGAPPLVLSSSRLPEGRVCVRMRATHAVPRREYRSPPGGGWCATTTPDPRARGRRRLVLRPSREDWAHIHRYRVVELAGPGLPARLEETGGLNDFAGHLAGHYRLPCVADLWCADR
jgi:hypothetical protein